MSSNVLVGRFRIIQKAEGVIYKYIVISSSGFASQTFKNNNPEIQMKVGCVDGEVHGPINR